MHAPVRGMGNPGNSDETFYIPRILTCPYRVILTGKF